MFNGVDVVLVRLLYRIPLSLRFNAHFQSITFITCNSFLRTFISHINLQNPETWNIFPCVMYRNADKSLARPGRKQANVSVRMA